jgi:DNA repair exonuclease SbcCD ATPase subunit
MGETAMLVR